MASEVSHVSHPLSRYRPALYLLTGVATAYALFSLHSHYVASHPQSSLQRRNAVRRRNFRRRGGISGPGGEEAQEHPAAIQALDQLEGANGAYGTIIIEVDDGRRIEFRLIPSQLASVEQLQQAVGVT